MDINQSQAEPEESQLYPEPEGAAATAGTEQPVLNVAVVSRYFAAISGRAKPAAVLDLYLADEELKRQVTFFERVFPCYVLVADDLIAQGDKVAVRARLQGTHAGDFMGIAPTMKGVNVPFIAIYRLDASRIAEHWMSIDQAELLKQLGIDG